MKLNIEKWNKKRQELEKGIREIKAVLATPGHQGTFKEWSDLGKLSYEATSMYMLRAELRGEGRLHALVDVQYVGEKAENGTYTGRTIKLVVPLTRDDQRKRALAGWHHDYLRAPEPVPAEAASVPASVQS